jgi:sugar O-acyltransferase (sialic acid O-acetyltransferase NeuD family)
VLRELIVYGASGFGQQVMFWVEDANVADPRFEIAGFVDDDASAHGETRTGHLVLGGRDWLEERAPSSPVAVVLGLATPDIKRRIVEGLAGLPLEFPTVVHPSAVVSRHARVGAGATVGPANVISVNVDVGEFATINTACTLGHDARVGPYATVLPGVNVSGQVDVGEGASIGTGAAITQGVAIGAGTTVGAGATVIGDLPPGCVAVGTPARPRAPRS